MLSPECIFCKIIKKEIPADVIAENDNFLAVKDINPKAPVHNLVIPKDHIPSVNHLEEKEAKMIGEMILFSKEVADKSGIAKGYKLVFNVGRDGGQLIDHIHLHVLGGWKDAQERDSRFHV